MEQVALSNEQLDYLASKHPSLEHVYRGALPSDGLPRKLETQFPLAFIVNTDPTGEPGTHWLALWMDEDACQVFDSFALPLQSYPGVDPFIHWLDRHCKNITTNRQSVQSVTTQTCGYYALFYLMLRSVGGTLEEFLNNFKPHDYLANDRLVGQMMQELVHKDGEWSRVCKKPSSQCSRPLSNKRV